MANQLKMAEIQSILTLRTRGWSFRRIARELGVRRYQVRSTMMTSNRPLEDWGKLIGDVPAATAILDRFLHNAEVITINGRSYRLKDRAARTAMPNARENKNEPACAAAEK